MSNDTATLVVTTFEGRNEVQVPSVFLGESGSTPSRQLVSYLRESRISIPEDGMLTVTDNGYVLHAVPKFG